MAQALTRRATARSAGGAPVVRGLGNGMDATIASLAGGSVWSIITHTGHYSNRKMKRSRVTLATSMFSGVSPMVETDLAAPLKFQVALEPFFYEGLTGIPARAQSYLFGESKVALYNGPGTNPTRTITSDWLDHPEIAANQKFGLYTVVENQLGAASPATTLPVSWNTSSYFNRNEGIRTNDAQDLGQSYIDTNAAEEQAILSAFNTGRAGGAAGFWPAMIEIEYDEGEIVVFILGDSMSQGVGLGTLGPDATSTPPVLGDAMGELKRGRGYAAMGLDALGINYINASKGSDGYKFLSIDGNMIARLAMLKGANPTHIFMGSVFNDLLTPDAMFLTNVTKVYDWIEATVPGIMIIQALAVPFATSTRTIASLTYDTATNTALATLDGTGNRTTADLIEGQTATITGVSPSNFNIRAPIHIVDARRYTFPFVTNPGIDLVGAGIDTGNAMTMNNEYRSLAGQMPFNDRYAPGGTNGRSSKNQLIRSRSGPFARCHAIFDPNFAYEAGYDGTQQSETGIWKVSAAQSFLLNQDGGHPNNNGQRVGGSEFKRQALARNWFGAKS